MDLERVLTGLLLGGVTIACFLVLQPFLSAMLWAGILVFTTWPVAETLRTRLGWPRGLVAGAMVLTAALIVAVPIALAVPGGADEVAQLRGLIVSAIRAGLPSAPDWLREVPLVGSWLASLWDGWAADLSEMIAVLRPHVGTLIDTGLTLLLGIANSVLMFMLALFIAFFFYLHGGPIAERLGVALRWTIGADADRYIALTGATVRGVVYGILGTAIVQGILTALGLVIAGVPKPMLLGVVAGFLSVLPVGAPLIWIPAALWLFGTDQAVWGVFLLVWGVVVISSADNFIRSWFIARGSNMPFLVTVLGVLGGALAFGLLGVFLGPVALGLGYTLFSEWAREREAPES